MTSTASTLQFGPVQVARIEESIVPLFDPLDIFPDCTPAILAQEEQWLKSPRYRDPVSGGLQLTMQSFTASAPLLSIPDSIRIHRNAAIAGWNAIL